MVINRTYNQTFQLLVNASPNPIINKLAKKKENKVDVKLTLDILY